MPALVVLAWVVRMRQRAAAARFVLGTAAGLVVVAGPFFAVTPGAMWHMVIVDQLGRGRGPTPLDRAYGITGVGMVFGTHTRAAHIALAVVGLVGIAVIVIRWRSRTRFPLALLGIQLVVLAASPSFFSFHENYTAASAAVVQGAATTPGVRTWATRLVVVAATATGTSYILVTGTFLPTSQRFPAAELTSGVADARCAMSDAPAALIEVNALSRGLAAGSPN